MIPKERLAGCGLTCWCNTDFDVFCFHLSLAFLTLSLQTAQLSLWCIHFYSSVLDTLAQLSFCRRHHLKNTSILYSPLSALLLPFCHSSPPTPPFLCSRLHLSFPLLLWIYSFLTEKGQQLLPDSTYQKSCQQFYSECLLFSAVKNVSQCSKTNLSILIERNGGNNPSSFGNMTLYVGDGCKEWEDVSLYLI